MSDTIKVTMSGYSLATISFSAKRGSIERPSTAFLLRNDNDYFLVTALHVLTGRHWQTKRPSDNGLIPEEFVLKIPFYKQAAAREHELIWLQYRTRFFDEADQADETVAPWLVHPKFREDVDVGIIPLSDLPKKFHSELMSNGMAEEDSEPFAFDWHVEPKLSTAVGDDVFILGFPENIKATGEMPIWKRGSLASEPDLPINGLPYVLVDTGTRSGMSGGPVVRRSIPGIVPFDNATKFVLLTEPRAELFGVYSGRYGADELTSQLGIVWKRSVIAEILATPTLGRSSLCTRLW